MADVNTQLGEQFQNDMEKVYGQNRFKFLKCDVSNSQELSSRSDAHSTSHDLEWTAVRQIVHYFMNLTLCRGVFGLHLINYRSYLFPKNNSTNTTND